MKTIVCRTPFDLAIEDRPVPIAAPGEVLVRIRRVGLCGTDYHIFAGRHPFLSYPRVMGHELSGEVVEAPAGSSFAPGQAVAINPYLTCGKCVACRKGKPNACVNIRVLGVHVDGGMTDLLALPESALVDVSGLSLDQAAMIEFLAIGAHAVARAAVSPGERVLVVGAGPIGIGTGLFARSNGAAVTLTDTRLPRLSYARDRLAFDDTVDTNEDLADTLSERTAGEMFDVVFDATGSLAAMAQSLAYVAHGGRLVLVGVAPGDLVFADPEFHKRETTLLASRNALSSDFVRVKQAIMSGEVPTRALHTHSLVAEELPEMMPQLIYDADYVVKAIASF
jgi:2-desacetyl-2-hydroxyethyl bacteriochlorophyllide A dehydrogenase